MQSIGPASGSPSPVHPARPRSSEGHRRRSKASQARRAARRARRSSRRRDTALAALLLGGLGLLVVVGMFRWLGQDPAAPTLARSPAAQVATAVASIDSPSATPSARPSATPTAPVSGGLQQAPAAEGQTTTSPGADGSATALPSASPTRRVTTTACANPPCLPFFPGTTVLDDGSSSDGSPGELDSRSWAATLSSAEAMATVVDYYRQQLAARQRAGDLAVAETSPGPGQVLLTVSTAHDGKQHSVWIGQAGPQVMIRLVTSAQPGR